jgi:hypothetical protein
VFAGHFTAWRDRNLDDNVPRAHKDTMLNEREIESCYLGQFIPVHYHHNMLMDQNRMHSFKSAIDYAVKPGARCWSWAVARACCRGSRPPRRQGVLRRVQSRIWCRKRASCCPQSNGEKVEVIHADAFEYLPPEPVDVVICEMIHVGMLREKQVEVIESFKRRYTERFGGPLPVFLPEAVIMAVQPLQQEYDFEGFYAPIVQFQETTVIIRARWKWRRRPSTASSISTSRTS